MRATASNPRLLGRPAPWLIRSYEFVLPSLAIAGLGLAVLVTAEGIGPLTLGSVVLLLALGSVALLTSAGTVRSLPPVAHRPRAPRPSVAARAVRPPPGALRGAVVVGRARSAPPVRRSAPAVRPAGLTGDMIWEGTPTPVVGAMPVDLVGPISEGPFVPDELYDPVALQLYGGRMQVDLAEAGAPPRSFPPVTADVAPVDFAFGPRREYIDLEALTPTPPHLRPTAPPVRPTPPRGPAGGAPGCATCDRPLDGEADWQRCTVCRDPMCSECLVRALIEQERAWCRGCAEWDAIEESYRSLNSSPADRHSAS
jgi:hypothetical protein